MTPRERELTIMLKAVKVSLIGDEDYYKFKTLIHNIDKVLEGETPEE